MSSHHQPHTHAALNPNLVAFIFIINFALIGGLIFANMPVASPDSDGGETLEVALLAPTETPLPLPTGTLPPTATAIPPSATPTDLPTATSAPQEIASSDQPATADSASYDPALVQQGETLYMLCAACHGPDARGLPNLGKDLVESEFVAGLTDEELVQFVITGRPIWDPLNTTGIDMPGKGGNPAMTTEDIQAIVAYLRALSSQSSGQAESVPVSAEAAAYNPALIAEGQALYMQCAACHGPDAHGLPNLGKDLVASEFVAGLTDEELLAFIKVGRPIWDPLNTTGIDMPGKGGNPALTDDNITAIIAYLRSLAAGNG